MRRPDRYIMLADSAINKNVKAGDIVYDCAGHDYGVSNDDTRFTGVKHVSVTINKDGNYPFFTVPESSLKPYPYGTDLEDEVEKVAREDPPKTRMEFILRDQLDRAMRIINDAKQHQKSLEKRVAALTIDLEKSEVAVRNQSAQIHSLNRTIKLLEAQLASFGVNP